MEMKTFKTKDFYHAAILMTLEFTLIKLEKSGKDFLYFIFKDPQEEAINLIDSYWRDQLQVNPKDLISNIKELKSRIYAKK